ADSAASPSGRSMISWRAWGDTNPVIRSRSWSSGMARRSSSRSRWGAGRERSATPAMRDPSALGFTSMPAVGTRGPGPTVGAILVVLAGALAASSGCAPLGSRSDQLVVATTWPPAERLRLESQYRNWSARSRLERTSGSIRLQWLILDPGDDLAGLILRRRP